jgi:glycosyltransferase involved in cell wall biosynthesis
VRFLGSKGRDEIRRLLGDCTIFVLPSRSEPFGMAVTEALACQKTVVASAVGGIPEIIEDGRSGLLVEPDDPNALADALLRVLGDDSLRASLAKAGHQRVRDSFGCELMGARYESVYLALLNGKG